MTFKRRLIILIRATLILRMLKQCRKIYDYTSSSAFSGLFSIWLSRWKTNCFLFFFPKIVYSRKSFVSSSSVGLGCQRRKRWRTPSCWWRSKIARSWSENESSSFSPKKRRLVQVCKKIKPTKNSKWPKMQSQKKKLTKQNRRQVSWKRFGHSLRLLFHFKIIIPYYLL